MVRDLIIVDSCVFIKAFRKDAKANNDLKPITDRTAYSVVTYLELIVGANTPEKKGAITRIFESYYGIPLNPKISEKAIEIMHQYISGQQVLSVPDCQNAATSITTGFPLLTYNKKDFGFINGIRFYE